MTPIDRTFLLSLSLVAGCVPATRASAADPAVSDDAFARVWRDGKAEVSGYRLDIRRYGESRRGQAVLIFVTEPFSSSRRVKVEGATSTGGDVVEVLKLNLVRDFQTGIYDYNTMLSLFVRSDDLAPLKLSFTSAEWCGHVYHELEFRPRRVDQILRSYFEGESSADPLAAPDDFLTEDGLLVSLRGLRGEFLRPGEKRAVTLLTGVFRARLLHEPLRFARAHVERIAGDVEIAVPAGTFRAIRYVVRTEDDRELRFEIERDEPRRVLSWSHRTLSGASEADETAKLTGSMRVAYWDRKGEGSERLLDELGLKPVVGPR